MPVKTVLKDADGNEKDVTVRSRAIRIVYSGIEIDNNIPVTTATKTEKFLIFSHNEILGGGGIISGKNSAFCCCIFTSLYP